jgi:LPXTG-motif cell wall-anchored protein
MLPYPFLCFQAGLPEGHDTVNKTITGQVNSISPFVIGDPTPSGYSTGANTNMIALLAMIAISCGLFLLRRQRRIS